MTHARDTIEDYLARLDAALREFHERERAELLAEVRAHLEESALRAVGSDAGVDAAVRSLGDPRELARRLRDADEEGPEQPAPERVKRVLGMPYNFKPLSAEAVASRVWNPADPRILMPRVFGIGWTLNFGAIAVRLGLVRPDDEEAVPFASVPDKALAAGLAAVTVANGAVVAAAALVRASSVPVHWGLAGPDRFAPPSTAAAYLLAPVIVLNAAALLRQALRASRTERALSVAGLAFLVVMLDGLYMDGLAWAVTGHELVYPGVLVLAALVLAFGVLVGYSRLGVRAEWRRARVK
ncbi:MAG TPA: DUF5808 domain-containing protein [Coriobacteriia bacterium]|jgi:hypothetical protein